MDLGEDVMPPKPDLDEAEVITERLPTFWPDVCEPAYSLCDSV